MSRNRRFAPVACCMIFLAGAEPIYSQEQTVIDSPHGLGVGKNNGSITVKVEKIILNSGATISATVATPQLGSKFQNKHLDSSRLHAHYWRDSRGCLHRTPNGLLLGLPHIDCQ